MGAGTHSLEPFASAARATVRLFVGIAPAAEVDRYLGDVERDVVDGSRLEWRPGVRATARRRAPGRPGYASLLGRVFVGSGRANARVGSRGRRLARSRDERRCHARHGRRHEHRSGAGLRALDRHRVTRLGCATRQLARRWRSPQARGAADLHRRRPADRPSPRGGSATRSPRRRRLSHAQSTTA